VADIAREVETDALELSGHSGRSRAEARVDLLTARRPGRYALLLIVAFGLVAAGIGFYAAGSTQGWNG
jgi:hypothetical protein